MRKRIGTTLAATSLLLGAAVGALWMLSWSRPYGLGFEKDAAPSSVVRSRIELTELSLFSMRGGLDVRYYWRTNPTAPADLRRWEFSPVINPKRLSEMPGQPTVWNRLGFYWHTGTPRGTFFRPGPPGWERTHFVFVGIPYWAIVVVTMIVPADWMLGRWRKRHLRRDGACPACGYDLTGNVSGVCPECGKPRAGKR